MKSHPMEESRLSAPLQGWPTEAPSNALVVPASAIPASHPLFLKSDALEQAGMLIFFVLCIPETGSGPASAPSGRSAVL